MSRRQNSGFRRQGTAKKLTEQLVIRLDLGDHGAKPLGGVLAVTGCADWDGSCSSKEYGTGVRL